MRRRSLAANPWPLRAVCSLFASPYKASLSAGPSDVEAREAEGGKVVRCARCAANSGLERDQVPEMTNRPVSSFLHAPVEKKNANRCPRCRGDARNVRIASNSARDKYKAAREPPGVRSQIAQGWPRGTVTRIGTVRRPAVPSKKSHEESSPRDGRVRVASVRCIDYPLAPPAVPSSCRPTDRGSHCRTVGGQHADT